jgi:hypothetical protein
VSSVESVLEAASERLQEIGSADVVLGIAAYNHGQTVGGVIDAAQAGLTKHFPGERSVIVVADGGSQDDTLARAGEASPNGIPILAISYRVHPGYGPGMSYDGIPNKGTAVHAALSIANRLGAKVCAVVGGNLQGLTPEWPLALVGPVTAEDIDFVTPRHVRHKHEGVLTTAVVYPLLRALYGRRIREPIGSEFALSGRFGQHCLSHAPWESVTLGVGIDSWLTTDAVCNGFRVAEGLLGTRGRLAGPALDPSELLAQVVGPIFLGMERHAGVWQRVRGSQPVPSFGPPVEGRVDEVVVNVEPMIETWRLGHQSLQDVWAAILPPATLLDLKRLARAPANDFRVADELWARVVYDFSLAHRLRTIARDHLLRAMTPLYLGWVASFVLDTRRASSRDVDERVERLSLAFEAQKPYLISRWRWPDRFNP